MVTQVDAGAVGARLGGRTWITTLVPIYALIAVTPWQNVSGYLLASHFAFEQITRRRQEVILPLLVCSTLYVSTFLGPIVLPIALIALLAVVRFSELFLVTSFRLDASGKAACVLAIPLLIGLDNYPATQQGRFILIEQMALFALVAGLSITGNARKADAQTGRAWSNTLWAGTCVALVAGYLTMIEVGSAGDDFALGRQVAGPFGGSNYVAALLALTILLLWIDFLIRGGKAVLLIPAMATMGCLMAPLASRASTLAVAVMLVVAALITRRLGRTFLVVVIVAAGAVWLQGSGLLLASRLAEVSGALESSGRSELWAATVTQLLAHPLTGLGPGGLADALLAQGLDTGYAHNLPLSFLAQYGLVFGFVALFALLRVGEWRGQVTRLVALSGIALSIAEPTIETLRLGIVFAVFVSLAQDLDRNHSLGRLTREHHRGDCLLSKHGRVASMYRFDPAGLRNHRRRYKPGG